METPFTDELMKWIAYALVALVFPAFFFAFFGRGGGGVDRTDRSSRAWQRVPGVVKMMWSLVSGLELSLGAALADMMPARARRIDIDCSAAGTELTSRHILATSFCLALVLLVLGAAAAAMLDAELTRSWPTWTEWGAKAYLLLALLVFAMAAIGWFWPITNIANAAELRQTEITRQLPFSIDLITSAMRSGLDFGAAVRHYTQLGTGGALEEEFTRVLHDVTYGKAFDEALNAMSDRVHIEAFSSFAGVVAYGAEIGASIADTLRVHGEELRRARFHLAEQKANRCPSLMVLPLAACFMPCVFIIMIAPLIVRWLSVQH